jgi:DEAD/DEAH box helicase domain-containing protein
MGGIIHKFGQLSNSISNSPAKDWGGWRVACFAPRALSWYNIGMSAAKLNVRQVIEELKRRPGYRGQIVHVERLPARRARYGRLSAPLPPALTAALKANGADRLYTHQAQAINAVRAGQHVIVTTPTASGKSLVYHLPVLAAIVADDSARALYLFPTKALAQDQLRALEALTQPSLRRVRFTTYDGDTPAVERAAHRRQAHIVLTNPDMLHLGILPHHDLWADFFRCLRFVVVDEAHVYRGVFGSHVAAVLRRLRRICALYGARPVFILATATIANPAEHAQRLTGLDMQVVADDGSPQGARTFLLWNPPFIDRARSARRSANTEAARLTAALVQAGLRTITFARARRAAEVILRHVRQTLAQETPELAALVKSYRGGYRPDERRQIERELFQGKLLAVTATSALELGIDVGELDAAVIAGYPGTIASTWQQAGRAGRGARESLAILVARDGPLDQYFMRHAAGLFGRPHERAMVAPDNVYVLEKHLPCAARERPLSAQDEALFGPGFVPAMMRLEEQTVLAYDSRRDCWRYPYGDYPAGRVNLRSIAGERFALRDESQNGRVLEEIEASSAFFRVHPGAVYLHQGESYLVTRLDLAHQQAFLRPVEVDYTTQPRQINDLRVVRSFRHRAIGPATAFLGAVRVTRQIVGYTRHGQTDDESRPEVAPLNLPPQAYDTMAFWFDAPPAVARQVMRRRGDLEGGLHAVEHATVGLLPLFAMCDRLDVDGFSTPHHPDTGQAQVFVYDAYPGGVGIAEQGFALLPELLQVTGKTVRDCPCQDGCPSCIQSPYCGRNNDPLDKAAAALILRALRPSP